MSYHIPHIPKLFILIFPTEDINMFTIYNDTFATNLYSPLNISTTKFIRSCALATNIVSSKLMCTNWKPETWKQPTLNWNVEGKCGLPYQLNDKILLCNAESAYNWEVEKLVDPYVVIRSEPLKFSLCEKYHPQQENEMFTLKNFHVDMLRKTLRKLCLKFDRKHAAHCNIYGYVHIPASTHIKDFAKAKQQNMFSHWIRIILCSVV